MADPQFAKYPDLSLAQDVFNLSNPSCTSTVRQNSLKRLQNAIKEHKMAPLYRHLAHPTDGILNTSGEGVAQQPSTNGAGSGRPIITSNLLTGRKLPQRVDFPWDEKLYDTLKEENKKELETYQKEEDEAGEAAGETEVLAAQGKRAEFWARVGDKVHASCSFYMRILIRYSDLGQSYSDVRSSARED
jgi:26S proteasome regulatory subunit N7